MAPIFLLFLLGFTVSVAQVDNNQCSPNYCNERALEKLLWDLEEFPGRYFLAEHCSTLTETTNCRVQAAQYCNETLLSEFEQLRRVANDLCQENSFRRDYLASVPCYNRIIDNLRNCSTDVNSEMHRFKESQMQEMSLEEIGSPFKYICLAIQLSSDCVIRKAANQCGLRAGMVLGNIALAKSDLITGALCEPELMRLWADEYRIFQMASYRMPEVPEATPEENIVVEIVTQQPIGTPASRGYQPKLRHVVYGLVQTGKQNMLRVHSKK